MHVAVVTRYHRASLGIRMVVNEMTSGNVVQHKALLLKKLDDLARLNGRKFRHTQVRGKQLMLHRRSGWVLRVS